MKRHLRVAFLFPPENVILSVAKNGFFAFGIHHAAQGGAPPRMAAPDM